MSAVEERRLLEFLAALRTPCEATVNPESSLVDDDFESEFRSKLLTHHCFIGSPLFQESFDSAFAAAARESGHNVTPATTGQRFWDLTVDGRSVSLKSTKAKNLRHDTLHISKLTEAAWIQDCRSAKKRRDETLALFDSYCEQVDAIIQLRFFRDQHIYELVEIPTLLFQQIKNVSRTHFAADGPTINIPIGANPPDFTLKLDRSDAKVTIANINKKLCTVHAVWTLGN